MSIGKGKPTLLLVLLMHVSGIAQGTLEEYQKSAAVKELFQGKVFNTPKAFHWIDDNIFWYVNNSRNGIEYFVVNSEKREQKKAFDQIRFAAALSKTLGNRFQQIP